MRAKPETLLIAAMAVFTLAGIIAAVAQDLQLGAHDPIVVDPALIGPRPIDVVPAVDPASASAWFQRVRPHCNPVEAETHLRWQPAPENEEGHMYAAACYALAGNIDLARGEIESLPRERRYHAAGVVFNTGHPAADSGDELAAGPLMELVVEYWPNHYMALYHAGAAAYERGEYQASADYLNRFLQEYTAEDGWRSNALSMLEAMGA